MNRSFEKPELHKKQKVTSHRKLAFILFSGVIFMFAFSYLMVPVFTFVCKQAGINGKNVLAKSTFTPDTHIDKFRSVKIEFTASIHNRLPFIFKPEQHYVKVHPGERKTVYFYAENLTGNDITIQAVPSITPSDGARFFKKIECFCFTQQFFEKNEKAKMFVNFYIDPDLPKEVKEITLAYTLFKIPSQSIKKISAKGRV